MYVKPAALLCCALLLWPLYSEEPKPTVSFPIVQEATPPREPTKRTSKGKSSPLCVVGFRLVGEGPPLEALSEPNEKNKTAGELFASESEGLEALFRELDKVSEAHNLHLFIETRMRFGYETSEGFAERMRQLGYRHADVEVYVFFFLSESERDILTSCSPVLSRGQLWCF